MTLAAFAYRARVSRAFDAEREALGEAGAQSYLGFQLQRVNGLVSSQENRRRLLAAAEDHRVAAARWTEIVGDVSVDWALEHHEAITAAARLRDDIHSIGQLSSGTVEVGTDQAAGLAQALVARLVQARNLGVHQESFPVILDDPFTGLAPHLKPALLELLRRTAGTPQAILLTDDEDVASWARLEALAGELTVLEPVPPRLPRRAAQRRLEDRVPSFEPYLSSSGARSSLLAPASRIRLSSVRLLLRLADFAASPAAGHSLGGVA